jgi:pimeloyl-ACP methyl ester carboxylesterase
MNLKLLGAALGAAMVSAPVYPEDAAAAKPAVQQVQVEDGVKLEVADWGGTGRTLILLGGLGATYHEFDGLAPKLAAKYRVLGITRRGFGGSSVPATGYSSDRLGDDVIAVIDALKLVRPVLVGHSMAGEELSSVGSRHPEKVAGLVYVEAAYAYAFYDPSVGDLTLDSMDLGVKLKGLLPGNGRPDQQHLTAELLQAMAQVERELKERQEDMKGMEDPPRPPPGTPSSVPIPIQGIFAGWQK